MQVHGLLLLTIGAIAIAQPTKAAVLFAGSAIGSWGAFAGGSANPSPVVSEDNRDGQSNHVATLQFGAGQGTPPNTFTFDGAGSDNHAAVAAFSNVQAGTLFDIGRFTYYNGSTTQGTNIGAVTLGIGLTLTAPSDANPATSSYSYNFGIDLTPNLTGNAVKDGDIVTINNGVTSTTFTSGGITYTLALKGFSTDGGKTFTSSFLSPEGSTATADIYAVINQPSLLVVSEPGSLVVLGASVCALGLVRRRRAS